MPISRKPARYWDDRDYAALADAVDGLESSQPVTYVQEDQPSGTIPDASLWVKPSAPDHAYVYVDGAWVSLQGPQGIPGEPGLDGLQGPQGDQGIPGADGSSSYTHIAYANNATGTSGFSLSDSTNKLYVGMYVDGNATDSTDPSVYRWTLIKGADGTQGIPGAPGANGQTPYLHIAYATAADGSTGFSLTDPTNKTYIGTYTDFTSADSSNPASYRWVKIQGPQGPAGSNGTNGTNGARGPGRFAMSAAVTQAYADANWGGVIYGLTPTGGWVFQDQVTVYNNTGSPPWSETRFWDGSAWQVLTQLIDGNLLVTGTVAGAALVADALKTSNYAYSGTLNGTDEQATAGAKMQKNGYALLVAPDGLKVGPTVFSDLWSWGSVRADQGNMPTPVSGAYYPLDQFTGTAGHPVASNTIYRGCITAGSAVGRLKVTGAGNYSLRWSITAGHGHNQTIYMRLMSTGGYAQSTRWGYAVSSNEINLNDETILMGVAANTEFWLEMYAEAAVNHYWSNAVLTIQRLPD